MPLLECSREERQQIFYLKTDIRVEDHVLRNLKKTAAKLLLERQAGIAEIGRDLGMEGRISEALSGTYHIVHVLEDRHKKVVIRSAIDTVFACDLTLGIESSARRWLAIIGCERLVPATLAVRYRSAGAPFDFAAVEHVQEPTILTLGDRILDERPEILTAIGRTLRHIHQVPGRGAGLLDVTALADIEPIGVLDDWRDYIELNLESHIDRCIAAEYIDPPIANRIRKHFDSFVPLLRERPMRLLHGDPGNHNLILDEATGDILKLLDWEDALVGDPLFDIAFWATFHPQRRHSLMLHGYGLQSPTQDERRLLALYFIRIALSKTVHRLRFGISDRPGYTPGHLRIHQGLEQLESLL